MNKKNSRLLRFIICGGREFSSKLDDMKFLGDFFGVAAAFDAELLEDVDDMRFDGGDLDTEDVGDLLVAAVAAQEPEHLHFCGRKRF